METRKVSMLPTSKWSVKVGKKVLVLNGREAGMLKQAILDGQRGIMWFSDMAINIPMIETILMIDSGAVRIESGQQVDKLTPEQRATNLKRIDAIKKGLAHKINWNK